jgi:hypothetical protein
MVNSISTHICQENFEWLEANKLEAKIDGKENFQS